MNNGKTKIELSNGAIEAKNQGMVSVVGNEIQHWMDEAESAKSNLSEGQKKKILERMNSLGDGIKNYAIYQDWKDDETLKNGK